MKPMISLLSFLLAITISTICMQPKVSSKNNKMVQIKTSDRQLYCLPQWQVEASRLLYTKQELLAFKEKCRREELYPLTLKTITKKKLELFYKAVAAKNFAEHYQKRTPRAKRQLINLAGENQLMSPILTI